MLLAKEEVKPVADEDLLGSGSTILNLAVSGRTCGAYPKGSYVFFVGDSDTGKTVYSMALFAEASINPNFKNYRYIYDGPEYGAMMDMRKFYGDAVADNIEYPSTKGPSDLIEEFYFNVDDAIQMGRPFIYVLDSMDTLDAKEDEAYFEKQKSQSKKKSEEGSGSYGTGKAKINSAYLRKMLKGLKRTGSILVIISQTRDNIGFGSQFQPKTRAGGRSLTFYAQVEIWTSLKTKIKKTVRKKQRQIGIMTKVRVKRSRLTGKDRTVEVPIHWSHGIDDVGSCVDYLIDEKHWTSRDGVITAQEFDYKGKPSGLIRKIENEGLEDDLRQIVGEIWEEIEEACAVKRKSRYRQEETKPRFDDDEFYDEE